MFFRFIIITLLLTSQTKALESGLIQDFAKTSPFKHKVRPRKVNLNEVIEQGLRENFDQHIREFSSATIQIDIQDTKSDFWVPKLKLELITAPQKLATLREGSKNTSSTSKEPAGSFGLTFEDYTVFNWGKDFLQYQSNIASLEREKDSLKEERRELKLDLIKAYFKLYSVKEMQKIYRAQLQKASFVYRLNREKVVLKKITKQDYYQSRSEYFRTQTEYYEAKKSSESVDEEITRIISDRAGTRYIPEDLLVFKEISLPIKEALKISVINNPDVLDIKTNLKNAKRDYEIKLKENLPLPKISVALGTWAHRFEAGRSSTRYETSPGNSDIELVATINASWPLTGSGGILNTRNTRRSLIQTRKFEKTLDGKIHTVQSLIRDYYQRILNYENQIKFLQERSKNIDKALDIIIDNYLLRKANFTDFSSILVEFRESKIDYIKALYNHLELKIELSKLLGLENFPGESFENLAKKRIIQ